MYLGGTGLPCQSEDNNAQQERELPPCLTLTRSWHRPSSGSTTRRGRALNDVLGIKLDVDGEFGPKTADACKQFQRASRIPVTGVADQQTWACLDISLDKLTK